MGAELRGITWDHVRGYGPLEASVERFEKETEVKITWDRRSLKNFGDASLEELARKYDLIILDHPHVGNAAFSKCIVPFDETLNTDVLYDLSANSIGPSYESYHYNGHQWALPVDAACQVSSYRSDLLNHPLPTKWADVLILAHRLRSQKQYTGIPLCPTDCMCSFLTLCAQQSGIGDDAFPFMSPHIISHALRLLRELFKVSHPDCISWNPIQLYDHMALGDDILYCPLAFGYVNYSQRGYAQNLIHFGAIPGEKKALLGGAGIAVSGYSRNIPSAMRYASWLCSEPYQTQTYLENGGQPAHKKAWLNKKANVLTTDFFSNTFSTIESAYVRPRTHNWPAFQEKLGEIIHDYLLNEREIKTTVKEIENCCKVFLKQ